MLRIGLEGPSCTNIGAKSLKLILTKLRSFHIFCKKVKKSGLYDIVVLCDHSMLLPWMSAFSSSGLSVIPYPQKVVYRMYTVPERHISGFSKSGCQLAVIEKSHSTHPGGLKPNSSDRFVGVDCGPFADSSVQSKLFW